METRKKIYEIIILFALISTLLVAFLIYPSFGEIQKNADVILQSRGDTIFAESESRQLANFQKDIKDYQDGFKKADQLLVDAQNPIDFIKFLEGVASSAGMTSEITLIPVSNDLASGALPKQFFKIHLRGDFANALTVVKKIENGRYLVTVDSLKMKKYSDPSVAVDPKTKKSAVSNLVDIDLSINVLSSNLH